MTIRGIVLGIALGLAIACATFFNDILIRQTMLIASHLPIVVFGVVVLVLLLINPLLRLVGPRAPLGAGEMAIIAAIGLAACPWPGSGFWRYGATIPGMPAHWQRTQASWQAQRVMSYLPGGQGHLAEGQVADWSELIRRLQAEGLAPAEPPRTVVEQLRSRLPRTTHLLLDDLSAKSFVEQRDRADLLKGINHALSQVDLFTAEPIDPQDDEAVAALLAAAPAPEASGHDVIRWNRRVVEAAMPSVLVPMPRGEGALLAGGRADVPGMGTFLSGANSGAVLRPDLVPWGEWWPTLRLWAGSMLLLGLASLCLAVIVHPQWARRELLSYPISRFVEEVAQRQEGAAWPDVFKTRFFWIGAIGVAVIHSINGLHTNYPDVPQVLLHFDFSALRTLFPNASSVALSDQAFRPQLYFSVVGFAFFLPAAIAFSLGISHVLFLFVGSVFVSNGIPMEYDKGVANKTNLMRFGSYVGMGLMIAYIGRRYYLNVMASAVGLKRLPETPRYAPVALWLGLASTAGAVWLLVRAGLAPTLAVMLVGVLLLNWLVLSRIVCETGAFFVTNAFHPIVVFSGLLGFEAVGPTGFLLIGIASWALAADPREAAMPYLSNALHMADRTADSRPGRVAPVLAVMLVLSMVVAAVVTLGLVYEHGAMNLRDGYANGWVPNQPFGATARAIADSSAIGSLGEATAASGLERWGHLNPMPGGWGWTLLGCGLVLATAAARLRLPWWPLHPVVFLIWGTYAAAFMAFSFLIGWIVKTSVVQVGGARAYHAVKPLMVGLIAGELFAGLLWMGIGATYYFWTGQPPVVYRIFPG